MKGKKKQQHRHPETPQINIIDIITLSINQNSCGIYFSHQRQDEDRETSEARPKQTQVTGEIICNQD